MLLPIGDPYKSLIYLEVLKALDRQYAEIAIWTDVSGLIEMAILLASSQSIVNLPYTAAKFSPSFSVRKQQFESSIIL